MINFEIFSDENFLIKNNIKNVSLISEATFSPALCLTLLNDEMIIVKGVDDINNFIHDLIHNQIQSDSNEPVIFFNKSKTDVNF